MVVVLLMSAARPAAAASLTLHIKRTIVASDCVVRHPDLLRRQSTLERALIYKLTGLPFLAFSPGLCLMPRRSGNPVARQSDMAAYPARYPSLIPRVK